MHTKKYSLVLIYIFSLLLVVPLLDMAFRFSKLDTTKENRIRGQDLQVRSKGAPVTAIIEAKYNDYVGLRDLFISLDADIHLFFLKTGLRNIVIGNDGWFFSDYNGRKSDIDVEEVISKLKINEGLSGGKLYLPILMSRKNEVYKEYAPSYFKTEPLSYSWGGYNDLLVELNKATEPVLNIIHTRPILIKAKKLGNTFYKKDGHWTPIGSYEVYRSITSRIETLLGSDTFTSELGSYFIIKRKAIRNKAGDLRSFGIGNILGKIDSSEEYTAYEPISEHCNTELHKRESNKGFRYEATINNTCGTEKKLLVIGSSFFEPTPAYGLTRFLSLDFRTTYYARRQTKYTQPEQLEKLIAQYKPDIIVDAVDLYR